MAKRVAECYYKMLRRFMHDPTHGKIHPFFTTFTKEHDLTKPTLGKSLICFLCVENNVDGALRLIHELNQNSLKINFPVDVIRILAKQGRYMDAFKVVMGAQSDLPFIDVVDYSIIIDGLCKGGHIDQALEICYFARKRGVTLNVVTYYTLFNGLCRQSCLIEAFRLFDSLESNNIIPSEVTYGTLIDALVREGFLSDARQLFERMLVKSMTPNIHIYNSLVNGYCKFGNVREALSLLFDLENNSLKPDNFTISAVLFGFSFEGNMEGALQFFLDMKERGFCPDFLGFLYLVRGLCSKGRMEESRIVLREMLQDQSVVELITRVNVEMEESIVSFLVNLCEQGNIQRALVILNEIGSMFYPYKRVSGWKNVGLICEENLQAAPLNTSSGHQKDFNAIYTQMTSLCSEGNHQEAAVLAKEMISIFAEC